VSRKAFTEAFNVMQELKDFDQEPNWTDAMVLSDKYSMSFNRIQLLAAAMFHAGWQPSKMAQRIVEKLRKSGIYMVCREIALAEVLRMCSMCIFRINVL
jgi:hypothetical protein